MANQKKAFTLGDTQDQSRSGLLSRRNKRVAFTLAEVLITIGVIGVVAAITIPGLMTNINKKVVAGKKTVMEKKLLDGINMLSNRENGLSVSYNNSEEFVRALSKYMKIVSICSNTELNKCFPYEKINYETENGLLLSENLANITTAKKLKLKNGNWLDPAGFVMADGTPIIMTYNNDCATNGAVDPDKPSKSIPTACIDGLYDNNGSRPQNKFGKDVLPFANARLGCLAKYGSLCIASAPVVPTPMSKSDCETEGKTKYGINACYHDPDYWAGAVKACKDSGGHLATEAELAQLASELYGTTIGATEEKSGLSLNTSKIPESFAGLGSSWYTLWSSSETSAYIAYGQDFRSSYTGRGNGTRSYSSSRAVCVE